MLHKRRFSFSGYSFILWLCELNQLTFLAVSSTWPRPALCSQETGSPMIQCHIFKIRQFSQEQAKHDNQRALLVDGDFLHFVFCEVYCLWLPALFQVGHLSMGNICDMQLFCTGKKTDRTLLIFLNHIIQSDIYSNSFAAFRPELFLNFIWQLTISQIVSFSWFF